MYRCYCKFFKDSADISANIKGVSLVFQIPPRIVIRISVKKEGKSLQLGIISGRKPMQYDYTFKETLNDFIFAKIKNNEYISLDIIFELFKQHLDFNQSKFFHRRLFSLCKKHIIIFFLLVLLSFVYYTEILSHVHNERNWFQLKCSSTTQCLRILLVADPQIVEHEQGDIWNRLRFITQYDSDSYLKRTYRQALNFVKPDVTIFLGDLMDEGSIATDEEYSENIKRFFNIFPKQGDNKQIWLPGDNDIGGEGGERVTPKKINRFNTHFKQADLIDLKKVTFFKVNYLINTFPKQKNGNFYNTSKINVVLSHVPLMFIPSAFVEKVISHLQPQVIFAGHKHRAMIINTSAFLRQDRHIVPVTPENNKVFKFTLGSTDLYEILVPTCSYRMGTYKIGFGFAVIENDELQYTVLWSPSRFHQLWNYIFMLLLLMICCIIVKFYKYIF